jgi:hypothetical protein
VGTAAPGCPGELARPRSKRQAVMPLLHHSPRTKTNISQFSRPRESSTRSSLLSLRENPTDAATVKDFEGGLDQWTHYELVDWFRALKANRTSKETCIEKHSFRAALRSMSDIA